MLTTVLTDFLYQFRQPNLQGSRNGRDVKEGYIPLTPLNATDVRPMESSLLCKSLLRPAKGLPVPAYSLAEDYSGVFLHPSRFWQ